MTYHQKMGFIARGMFAILGKGMLEKTFDRGLELLKNYSEAHAADMPAGTAVPEVTEIQFPAHIYAGIKGKVAVSDPAAMQKFFDESYALIAKEAKDRIAGPPVGIVINWNDSTMSGEMMAAFPVKDNKPVKGAEIMEVAASSGYEVHAIGAYDGMALPNAHMALAKKVAEAGKTMNLRIEEYIKTPGDTKDPNQCESNVIYLVK
jgi:hypothetical protein